MRVIHDTEFPNSVDATQKLLDEQGAEYERLKVCFVKLCDDDNFLYFKNFIFFLGRDFGGS